MEQAKLRACPVGLSCPQAAGTFYCKGLRQGGWRGGPASIARALYPYMVLPNLRLPDERSLLEQSQATGPGINQHSSDFS